MVRYYYTAAATFWDCHSSQYIIPSWPWQESRSQESLEEKWMFMSRSPLDFQNVEKTFQVRPLFLILWKITFLKVGGVFPPPPFGTRGVIFRMKDGILKLRPKGVDGCLMTGAIQDHFVGFRLMTILTGQSYISKVNIFCCDVKAEEQIISLILLSKLNNFLLLLQYSLSPLEIGERYLRFFFLLSKLEQRTILFSFRKCPQTTCKRRRKVTLVAFVWLISTVSFTCYLSALGSEQA